MVRNVPADFKDSNNKTSSWLATTQTTFCRVAFGDLLRLTWGMRFVWWWQWWLSAGMWWHVDWQKSLDTSMEQIDSFISDAFTKFARSDYYWFQTFAMFCVLYVFFWLSPRRLNFICRRFGTLCLFHLHRQVGKFTYLPMKMEQTECSETSVYKIQTSGN